MVEYLLYFLASGGVREQTCWEGLSLAKMLEIWNQRKLDEFHWWHIDEPLFWVLWIDITI